MESLQTENIFIRILTDDVYRAPVSKTDEYRQFAGGTVLLRRYAGHNTALNIRRKAVPIL